MAQLEFNKIIKKYSLFIILALLAGATITAFFSSYRFAQNFFNRLRQGEITPPPQIQQLDIPTSSDITANYKLLEGWNFVAFPVKPIEFTTAAGLIQDVIKQGGYVTTVSAWDGDRWQEFSQRGLEKFGFDFNIYPGQAYFLKNEQLLDSWEVIGIPVTPNQLALYQLEQGWNTLGIVQPNLKAQIVLDSINQGKENATVINWWWSGDWDLFIKRYYDTGQIEEYGNNFPILNTHGYMILLNQPTTWRP